MYSIKTYCTLVVFLITTYSFVNGVKNNLVMNSEDYARYRREHTRPFTNSGSSRNAVGPRRGSTRDTTTRRAASSGTGNTRVKAFSEATDIVVLEAGQASARTIVNQLLQGTGRMTVGTLRKLYPWIRNPKQGRRTTVPERRWKVPDFRRLRTTLGLNDYNEFIAQRGLELINGSYKVRVQQKWRGIRCYSSNLVVEQNDYGELYTDTMSGRFLSDIEVDIRDNRPRTSKQQAIRTAKRFMRHTTYLTENENAELYIYDRKAGGKMKAVLAYIVNYYVPAAEPVSDRGRTTSRTAGVTTENTRTASFGRPRTQHATLRQTGARTNRNTGSGISYIPGQFSSRSSRARSSSKLVSPVNSSRPYVIINAHNSQVLESWDGLAKAFVWQQQNLMTGNKGSGYKSVKSLLLKDSGTNICRYSYPLSNSETLDVFDEKQNTHTDFNCNDGNTQQYDNTKSAASPRNNAFHWAIKTHTLLKQITPSSTFPTRGLGLKYEVHHHSFRAEFTGIRILLGDGLPSQYPQSEPDWVAHETAHVFTEYSSGLNLKGEAGALAEAFSDMAASTLMHENNIRNPYIIGRSTLQSTVGFGGSRDLCNPHNPRMLAWEPPSQIPPKTYDEMIRQGSSELHLNSAVMSRAFCILSKKSGWTPSQSMKVFLVANYLYWRPTTTFAEAACSLIKATKDLRGGGRVKDMFDTMSQVGVKCTSQV